MQLNINFDSSDEIGRILIPLIKDKTNSFEFEKIQELFEEQVRAYFEKLSAHEKHLIVMDATTKVITKILFQEFKVSEWNTTLIQPFIENIVNEALKNKDWDKLADDLAMDKLRNLLNL